MSFHGHKMPIMAWRRPHSCAHWLHQPILPRREAKHARVFNVRSIHRDAPSGRRRKGTIFVVTRSGPCQRAVAHDRPADLRATADIQHHVERDGRGDNVLACYLCPSTHKALRGHVDTEMRKVTTPGLFSNKSPPARPAQTSTFDGSGAKVRPRAALWPWPNTRLMRYPQRPLMTSVTIIPAGHDPAFETNEFVPETPLPAQADTDTACCVGTGAQLEDFALVESLRRGINTPAFRLGRIVHDPHNSGKAKHRLHHFSWPGPGRLSTVGAMTAPEDGAVPADRPEARDLLSAAPHRLDRPRITTSLPDILPPAYRRCNLPQRDGATAPRTGPGRSRYHPAAADDGPNTAGRGGNTCSGDKPQNAPGAAHHAA